MCLRKRYLLGSAVAFGLLAGNALQAATWNNAGTDFNNATNWTGGLPTGGLADFAVAPSQQPILSGNISIDSLSFSSAANSNSYLLGATSPFALTLTSIGSAVTSGGSAITALNTSGTNTISAPIILGGGGGASNIQTIVQAPLGKLVLSGGIGESTANSLLRFLGTAVGTTSLVELTAASSYTGNTIIGPGAGTSATTAAQAISVLITNKDALGTTGGGTFVNSGSRLQIQGGLVMTEALTLNGVTSGTGAFVNGLESIGANEWAGAITANSASNVRISSNTAATVLTLSGAITTADSGALVITGSGDGIVSGAISGTAGVIKTGSGVWTLTNTNNSFSGRASSQTGILQTAIIGNTGSNSPLGANSGINLSTGTLQYTGTGETSNKVLNLNTDGNNIISQAGTGPLVFTANLTITSGAAKTLILTSPTSGTPSTGEIAGIIPNTSASVLTSVSKTGNNIWLLSNANTYTGTTTVGAGTLRITGSGTFGSSTAVTVTGGTLDYNGLTRNVGAVTLGGVAGTAGILNIGSGGQLNLTNSVTYNAANNGNVGTIQNGKLNLGATTRSFVINDSTNAAKDLIVSSQITGTGGINKSGAGHLSFEGAVSNDFSGTVTVSTGTLTLAKTGGATALVGSLVNNGGNILLTAGVQNQIADNVAITQSAGNFNGTAPNNSQVGTTETIGSLALTGGSFSAGSLSVWTIAGALSFTGGAGNTVYVGNTNHQLSTNSLSLTNMTATAGGTASTPNSFTLYGSTARSIFTVGSGGITLDGSRLNMRHGTDAAAGTRLILDGNISVVNAASFITEDIAGGTLGTLDLELSSTAGNFVRTINTGADLTIGVNIKDGAATSGGLTKTGSSKLTLTGANSYTGATTISNGTLALSGTGTLGTGNVIVNSILDITGLTDSGITLGAGQTLSGEGNIAATGKSVIVNGILAPGNSPGTLNVTGAFLLGSSASSLFEIDALGVSDLLNVTGSLTYGGTLTINTSLATGSYDLFNATSVSGDFSAITLTGTGFAGTLSSLGGGDWSGTDGITTAYFQQSNGVLTFTAIPEPSTLALGGLALLGFAGFGLRKRRMAKSQA